MSELLQDLIVSSQADALCAGDPDLDPDEYDEDEDGEDEDDEDDEEEDDDGEEGQKWYVG